MLQLRVKLKKQKKMKGSGFAPGVECLPSKYKILSSIPRSKKIVQNAFFYSSKTI